MSPQPLTHTQVDEDAQDLQLVEAIRRGDTQAWAKLITKHQDRVYATCVRMVHNRDLAADLAQDSFVKIIQGIGSFDGRAKFSTWMTRVVMNVCLSKLRSEKLRRHASLERMGQTTQTGDLEAARPQFEQTREPAAHAGVEEHEDRERVLTALRYLDPEHRAVLILCDCRGLPYEQIADVLGVAVGTVKSRLFRARNALREAVEALAEGRPVRKSDGV